jgi:hypothetical protein
MPAEISQALHESWTSESVGYQLTKRLRSPNDEEQGVAMVREKPKVLPAASSVMTTANLVMPLDRGLRISCMRRLSIP